jgi:cobalt-zinc-cadmium efflux system membrane fusion protein
VVANPERLLKAEMLATARIERIVGSGVVVPSQAVQLLGSRHTVMVQVQPGVFESRDVELSYQGPRESVVSSGLEVGEQVVSENTLLLAREFRTAQNDARPAPESDKKRPAAAEIPSQPAPKKVAPSDKSASGTQAPQ